MTLLSASIGLLLEDDFRSLIVFFTSNARIIKEAKIKLIISTSTQVSF